MSETGPSPEASPREPYLTMAFKALYPNITRPVAWPGLAPHKWLIVGDVALAIEAAVRSAHLQDARAGCRRCAGEQPTFETEPVPRSGWPGRWHRERVDLNPIWWKCERPEVWDALSLLPPK